MTEDEARALAERLRPYLGSPGQGGVLVTVARIKKNELGGKVLAYLDLAFHLGGVDVCTVEGFKLMGKEDGTRWLATPQTKHERVNPENGENKVSWRDTFKWGHKNVAEAARKAASDAYKADDADIPFDGSTRP